VKNHYFSTFRAK